MLDEALEPFLRQLRDRIELGRLDDAARIARGIVAGLDAVDGNYDTTDYVLGMSPDWAGEAAGYVVELCKRAGVDPPRS